jgi:hypothetical protein
MIRLFTIWTIALLSVFSVYGTEDFSGLFPSEETLDEGETKTANVINFDQDPNSAAMLGPQFDMQINIEGPIEGLSFDRDTGILSFLGGQLPLKDPLTGQSRFPGAAFKLENGNPSLTGPSDPDGNAPAYRMDGIIGVRLNNFKFQTPDGDIFTVSGIIPREEVGETRFQVADYEAFSESLQKVARQSWVNTLQVASTAGQEMSLPGYPTFDNSKILAGTLTTLTYAEPSNQEQIGEFYELQLKTFRDKRVLPPSDQFYSGDGDIWIDLPEQQRPEEVSLEKIPGLPPLHMEIPPEGTPNQEVKLSIPANEFPTPDQTPQTLSPVSIKFKDVQFSFDIANGKITKQTIGDSSPPKEVGIDEVKDYVRKSTSYTVTGNQLSDVLDVFNYGNRGRKSDVDVSFGSQTLSCSAGTSSCPNFVSALRKANPDLSPNVLIQKDGAIVITNNPDRQIEAYKISSKQPQPIPSGLRINYLPRSRYP